MLATNQRKKTINTMHTNWSPFAISNLKLLLKHKSCQKHILLCNITKSLEILSEDRNFIVHGILALRLLYFIMDRLIFLHIHLKVNT